MDLVRSYLGRVLGSVVAGLSIWLGETLGAAWAPTEGEQAALAALGVTVALALYSAVHRWVNSRLNPADKAAPAATVPK